MKNRILTGFAIFVTLILCFALKIYAANWVFDVLILGIGVFAAYESSKMFARIGFFNHQIVSIIFPAALFVVNLVGIANLSLGMILLSNLIAITVFALGVFVWNLLYKGVKKEIKLRKLNISKTKFALKKSLGNLVCFVYPSFLIMLLMLINNFDKFEFGNIALFDGKLSFIILIFTFLIPIITDTFAMFSGMLFGGKKLCPKISPKKTVSGAIGGIVWCVLICCAVYLIMNATAMFSAVFATTSFSIWKIIIISLLGSIFAQCGDLFESFIKRKAEIKDSGNIFPGHGGMLDRVDSHIFVAVFMLLSFVILVLF